MMSQNDYQSKCLSVGRVSSSFKWCLLILFVAPGQNKGRSLPKVTFVTFAKKTNKQCKNPENLSFTTTVLSLRVYSNQFDFVSCGSYYNYYYEPELSLLLVVL